MTTTSDDLACISNEVTGAQYQGGNVERLILALSAAGYDPAHGWAGFHQWRTVGRTVRKGEHGTHCRTVITVDQGEDGRGTSKVRGFVVFHFDQTDELAAPAETAPAELDAVTS